MFHFQDGEPANYAPMAGDLVLYSADSRNIHCVDEITDGERITLTLWFSRNMLFDEDTKLISLLSGNNFYNKPATCIPLPAPTNMYWFSIDQGSDDQRGYDIHLARMFSLGYDIYSTQEKSCIIDEHTLDSSELVTKPLRLAREDKLICREFSNLLHALQVVLFYYWKQPVPQQSEVATDTNNVVALSEGQREVVHELRSVLLSAMQLDKTFCCHPSPGKRKFHFDWACFSAAVTLWEEYTFELHNQLLMHLPFWKDNGSLFSVSSSVIEE